MFLIKAVRQFGTVGAVFKQAYKYSLAAAAAFGVRAYVFILFHR
jgi:hypothetical protein